MDEANGPGDEAREWMTSVSHHADLVQIYRRSLALRQSSPGRSPGPVSDQVSGSALGHAPAVPAVPRLRLLSPPPPLRPPPPFPPPPLAAPVPPPPLSPA